MNVVVEGSSFDNNTADADGIIFANGNVSAVNSKFSNNYAKCGAGIYSKYANLDNCVFFNNTAESGGGAVYTAWLQSTIHNLIPTPH